MNEPVILCVDDEEIVLKSLQRELNSALQHEYLIETAEGGEDALELFEELLEEGHAIPLVISDHIMPGMKGDELLTRIHQRSPTTLNIMLTGQADLDAVANAVNHANLYQYVAKPWETAHLSLTVKEALRRYVHERTIEEQHANLRSAYHELEQLNVAYERFVPREFLSFLNKTSILDVQLGDQVQQALTILFADIRSFATLSEQMTPQENFDFLNGYLGRMGPIIRTYHGIVDKYIGDAVMALFPRRADDALQAAIAMWHELGAYNATRIRKNQTPITIGIGLHFGHVMLGTIGEAQRLETTVISDAVNLAARLEGLTKIYGASIIVSEQVLTQLRQPESYQMRFLGKAQLKGKKDAVAVFEVFDADPEEIRTLKHSTKTEFEDGLNQYHARAFMQAIKAFQHVLNINPHDKPARLLLDRSARYLVQEIPDDWQDLAALS